MSKKSCPFVYISEELGKIGKMNKLPITFINRIKINTIFSSLAIINLTKEMNYYDAAHFREKKILLIYNFEMHRHINVSCAKKELQS